MLSISTRYFELTCMRSVSSPNTHSSQCHLSEKMRCKLEASAAQRLRTAESKTAQCPHGDTLRRCRLSLGMYSIQNGLRLMQTTSQLGSVPSLPLRRKPRFSVDFDFICRGSHKSMVLPIGRTPTSLLVASCHRHTSQCGTAVSNKSIDAASWSILLPVACCCFAYCSFSTRNRLVQSCRCQPAGNAWLSTFRFLDACTAATSHGLQMVCIPSRFRDDFPKASGGFSLLHRRHTFCMVALLCTLCGHEPTP
jgi:hypothetical protein